MANRQNFKMTTDERRRRTFSLSFKVQKVKEIELRQTKISEICRQYEISDVSVYKWIEKFGSMKKKKTRIVVESESDTKQLLDLKRKVAELERIIGQKQILIEFKDKMIEIAEETYGVDIKKKFSEKPSNSSGNKENDTPLN